MTENDLLNAIDVYRASPLTISFGLKDSESLRLILEVKNLDRRTVLRGPAVGLSETLQNIFRQVTAGPEKADVLKSIYSFPSHAKATEYRESSVDYILNEHPENIPSFLRFVCQKAKLSSEYFLAKEERQLTTDFTLNNDRFVLSGPKGSGKTVLLNFILSCHANIMDEFQVIWVRVDLTKPGRFSRVRHRFERQTLWILANKYFSENMLPPRTISEYARSERLRLTWGNFEKYLRTQPNVAEGEHTTLVSYFQTISAAPEEEIKHRKTGEEQRPKEEHFLISKLFGHAQRFCLTQGFSFFFILDGLDAAIPDTEREEEFEDWLEDAVQLFAYDERFSGAFLISLREESRRKLLSRSFGKSNPRSAKPRSLYYSPVCPNVIIGTRFEKHPLLKTGFESQLGTGENQTQEILEGLKEICIDFIAEGMQIERRKALPYLLEILNGDVRSLMKAVALTLEKILSFMNPLTGTLAVGDRDKGFTEEKKLIDILLSKEQRRQFAKWKAYGVMETLLLGRYRYFHVPFAYELREDGGKEKLVTSANFLYDDDAGFLINCFDYPEDIVESKSEPPRACAIFHKISMLRWIRERSDSDRPMPVKRRSLEKHFVAIGIPEILVEIYLKEFLFFGLLKEEDKGGSCVVHMTKAGRYVVENLCTNFDYVMAIAENTPLPASVFKAFESVEIGTDTDLNAARLINCVTFTKYLLALKDKCPDMSAGVGRIIDEISANEKEYTARIVKAAYQDNTQRAFRNALERRFKSYTV